MSIQLKDLLNAEVKKKLENLEKNPKAKLPKQKKVKKQILKEDKGTDLADRMIAQFRKSAVQDYQKQKLENSYYHLKIFG